MDYQLVTNTLFQTNNYLDWWRRSCTRRTCSATGDRADSGTKSTIDRRRSLTIAQLLSLMFVGFIGMKCAMSSSRSSNWPSTSRFCVSNETVDPLGIDESVNWTWRAKPLSLPSNSLVFCCYGLLLYFDGTTGSLGIRLKIPRAEFLRLVTLRSLLLLLSL